jgi:hypothetical protein
MRNHIRRITRSVLGLLMASIAVISFASTPLISIDSVPQYRPQLTVAPGGIGYVEYLITNRSKKTHTLLISLPNGIVQTQTHTADDCRDTGFTLSSQRSCRLGLRIIANQLSNTTLRSLDKQFNANFQTCIQACVNGSSFECYQSAAIDCLNIQIAQSGIAASVSDLALSINDPSLNPALTGNPRQIIIRNTGGQEATNVVYSVAPALPTGASISPESCGTIPLGSPCVLTITPGTSATTTPITLSVKGSNTNALSLMINVLTYGSLYQGGYIFSIDDAYDDYPETLSIGGTIAAQTNQAAAWPNGIIWSSNSGSGEKYAVCDAVPGISYTQFGTAICTEAASDGACNTNEIISYYNNVTNGALAGACGSPSESSPIYQTPIPLANYAAGLCRTYTVDSNNASPCATGVCYSDWYLPSICEMGYAGTPPLGWPAQPSPCTPGTPPYTSPESPLTPIMQNMQSSLIDNPVTMIDSLTADGGIFWSSTEYYNAAYPTETNVDVWYQTFVRDYGGYQNFDNKQDPSGVRCVRKLIQNP